MEGKSGEEGILFLRRTDHVEVKVLHVVGGKEKLGRNGETVSVFHAGSKPRTPLTTRYASGRMFYGEQRHEKRGISIGFDARSVRGKEGPPQKA